MLDIDLRSLKRHSAKGPRGWVLRFVIASDLDGMSPEEQTLRGSASYVTAQLGPTGNTTYATQWVLSTQGWVAVMQGQRDFDDAEEWLTAFAALFVRAEGKIIGGPRERSRSVAHQHIVLAANLYLTTADMREVDRNDHGWYWGVDETTTRYMCDQLRWWVHQPRATSGVATDAWHSFEATSLDHIDSFTEMVLSTSWLRLETEVRDPLRYLTAEVRPQGKVGVQAVDPTLTWRDQLDQLSPVLTWTPPRTDYAYVRRAWGNGGPCSDDGQAWPHWDDIDHARVQMYRPLLASFVPDAHGIQLLTDAHLDHAHDLTNWDITPLSGGRHLVAAKDLEAWFQPIPGPNVNDPVVRPTDLLPADPDLIAEARADFGDMIITRRTLEEHNPWT